MALFVIKDDSPMLDHIKAGLQAVVARDHIVRASLLCTDVALSAPLSATAAPAQADRVAMIEATVAASAFDAASSLASQLPAEQVGSVFVFQMMMRLGT